MQGMEQAETCPRRALRLQLSFTLETMHMKGQEETYLIARNKN